MTPTLILTRPEPRNAAFADAVRRALGRPVEVLNAPLMRIVPVAADVDPANFDGVIFTSVNGVAQVARLQIASHLPAWCVGESTAEAARALGFDPVVGPGDAAGLAALIAAQRPLGRLVHLRGRHARGDLAETLQGAGVNCADLVVYDQQAQSLTDAALRRLAATGLVVVPLFSPRAATLFSAAGPFAAPLHLVAMSDAVAEAASPLGANSITVAAEPTQPAMVAATVSALRAAMEPDR